MAEKHTFTSFRALSLTLFFALNAAFSFAQTGTPNGYVDINKVLQAMPGYKDSIKKLDNIRVLYQNQYNYLLVDLQQKIKEYDSKKDSFSPFVANIKLQEIRKGQANLDTFQVVANQALQMQQDQMLSGFLKKIRDEVAVIGNLRHMGTIWDANMLKNAIWTDPKSDITEDVIKSLTGVKTTAAPATSKDKPKKK